MNQTKDIDLQLFYISESDKTYYKVRWYKKKEIWDGMNFIGFSEKVELRMSGNFTTKGGAQGFVNDLKYMKGFTGKFEIIEYKPQNVCL